MIVKTWRDPYEAGFSPTKPKEIELKPGLTVLVGCNGAGKTTLLLNIKEHCKNNGVPCLSYDNLHDGGSNAMSSLFYFGDYEGGADLFTSSEGEGIKINISMKSSTYKEFIQKGYVNDRQYRLNRAFAESFGENIVDVIECKDRVFLFDAVDSGLSVDSVVEIRDLFDLMLEDNRDSDRNLPDGCPEVQVSVANRSVATASEASRNIYIVIAANEYELARNADCFDVNSGCYVRFSDYEEYRNFILKSRALKEKRIEKQQVWREKQKTKEIAKYKRVKAKQEDLLRKYWEKYKGKEPPRFDWELREIERITENFFREARFVRKEDVEKERN